MMQKTVFITSPRVNNFLEAKGRNSKSSRIAYTSALEHLNRVIEDKYPHYNYDSIIEAILNKEVDVYELFNNYISYTIKRNVTPKSIKCYISALKSYFGWNDVDIIPHKFKKRVVVPTVNRIDEEALEASDMRKILLACNNRRLKTYLLVLASSGVRAVEGLAIRNCDCDFSQSPTKIKIRAKYSKTKNERYVFISNEATGYLQQWLDWKYKNPEKPRQYNDTDLVFTVYGTDTPQHLYNKIWVEFKKLLSVVKMDKRKDEGFQKRRRTTIHSIRRLVYTTICDVADQAYAEWFLGHSKSVYHTKKEAAKREIYANKIMKYLTYLDYSGLEATGKSIEAKLEEKDREIAQLKKRDTTKEDAISNLSDQVMKMTARMEEQDKLIEQLLRKK